MNDKKEHKLIQSYVYDKYFVSTAYRQSSAAIANPPWYYETIVWEWNSITKERGNILEMDAGGSSPESGIINHFKLIEQIPNNI